MTSLGDMHEKELTVSQAANPFAISESDVLTTCYVTVSSQELVPTRVADSIGLRESTKYLPCRLQFHP